MRQISTPQAAEAQARLASTPDLVLEFNPAGQAVVAATGDFDGNGTVDGNDFLMWQRGGNSEKLEDWNASFGASEVTASSESFAALSSEFDTPAPKSQAAGVTGVSELAARDAALA
jgi:hypothetical protein